MGGVGGAADEGEVAGAGVDKVVEYKELDLLVSKMAEIFALRAATEVVGSTLSTII